MKIWNVKELFMAPAWNGTNILKHPEVNAIFFNGLTWKGKPTKIFAWYGVPGIAKKKKVPGMVLVHGGGGTAYAEWVKLWNSRGYAAIAMDTCGGIPDIERRTGSGSWTRHDYSGPEGWGNFEQSDLPPGEQWMYHAVASAILGNSLLRSFVNVDPGKIGITGVSWGGVITCIAAGLDHRFAFAVPVYGCGFLDAKCVGLYDANIDKQKLSRWMKLWDPSTYLKNAHMPFLWLNGTNDPAFPLNAMQKSYRLTKGDKRICIRVRMSHSHGEVSEKPPEIMDFAEAVRKGGELSPLLKPISVRKGIASASFKTSRKIVKAEFNFTRASGYWKDRFWNTIPAELDAVRQTVSAKIPYAATTCFFNLFDESGLIFSSELSEK